MNEIIAVLVTIPEKKAKTLANTLLKEKVCACINIVQRVKSLFWWKGKITSEQEALLIIKTKKILFPKLKKMIKDNHPYEVPEIIALDATGVNRKYKKWLISEVKK